MHSTVVRKYYITASLVSYIYIHANSFVHFTHTCWYLSFDEGTPVHLSIMKIQLEDGATMIQAMTVPPGTPASDVRIWAESRSRPYDFTLASSLGL